MIESIGNRTMTPTVVVVAFNRPASLARLLGSLAKAHYPPDVTLVISIDGGGDPAVCELAERFDWRFGPKQLRVHSNNLGLKEHVLSCGDLTEEHDTVIVLEDDLFVSPHFYTYASEAQAFYSDEPRVAGVSLYSHQYNEAARLPFMPIDDNSDVYFMQIAASCGQTWSHRQWAPFRAWLATENDEDFDKPGIPKNVRAWPDSSWKKYFIKYLDERGLFFVYPRLGVTTNFGDRGTHYGYRTTNYQTPICTHKDTFQFSSFELSSAKYDAWCEALSSVLAAANSRLKGELFSVDLFGARDPAEVAEPMILTRQRGEGGRVTFGLEMKPLEANILCDVSGMDIGLYPRADVRPKRGNGLANSRSEHVYFYHDTSLIKLAGYLLASVIEKSPNVMFKLRQTLSRVQQWRV